VSFTISYISEMRVLPRGNERHVDSGYIRVGIGPSHAGAGETSLARRNRSEHLPSGNRHHPAGLHCGVFARVISRADTHISQTHLNRSKLLFRKGPQTISRLSHIIAKCIPSHPNKKENRKQAHQITPSN